MLKSRVFQQYWETYNDKKNSYLEVVYGFELVMTQYFQKQGFQWDIYADTSRYQLERRSENINLYLHHSCEMMRQMRFPLLKRKVLNLDLPKYLYYNDLEEPAQAMEYVREQSNYPEDLIWESAVRLYHPYHLCNSLHLRWIFPSQELVDAPLEKAAVIFVHLSMM